MAKTTKTTSIAAHVGSAIRALHLAATRDDVSMARRALSAGADINARAPGLSGETALYRAAHAGSTNVARVLLEQGASVHLESEGGTALTAAAQGGHFHIVRRLVDDGADVDYVSPHGMTARDAAIKAKKTKVADYLLARTGAKNHELQLIARAYAKRYSGKVTPDRRWIDGGPLCLYEVAGKHRGRSLKFRIFDGGCMVEGATAQIAKGAISVNAKAIRATVPVPQVGGGRAPRLFRQESITDKEARAALAAPSASLALLALGLARGELLAINHFQHFGDSLTRPTFFFIHRDKGGPDFAALDARLDVLATLLPWRVKRAVAPEGPVFSTNAYRIIIGARVRSGNGNAPHTFGGTLDHDLKCRNCKTPIHLLLTIDTRAPGLQLPSLSRREFRIVYCLNCMSFPGLIYLDFSKPRLRIVRQDKQERVNEDGPYPARKVALAKLRPATRLSAKIGGTPNWLQAPEIPNCVACRKPMAFLAQIRSLPDLSFVDEGMLYTFVCTACKVSGSLIQSH